MTSAFQLLATIVLLQTNPDRFVVVTSNPLEADLRKSLRSQTVEGASKQLSELRFVSFVRDGRLYFVSPDLDSEERQVKLLNSIKGVAISDNGTVSPNSAPAVGEFMESLFSARFERIEEAEIAVSPSVTLFLNHGSKSVTIRKKSPLTPQQREKIRKKPLSNRESVTANPPASLTDLTLRPQLQMNILTFGTPEYLQTTWAKHFEVVSTFLNLRLSLFRAHAHEALANLWRHHPDQEFVEAFSGIDRGASLASLSGEQRRALDQMVVGDFQRYGFRTEDEASAFMNYAKIRDFSKGFMVTAAKSKGGLIAYSFYP